MGDSHVHLPFLLFFCGGCHHCGMFADTDIDKIPDDELIGIFLIVSLGSIIINTIFAFTYNKQYTTRLLESGYEPTDEYSKGILRSKGIIA